MHFLLLKFCTIFTIFINSLCMGISTMHVFRTRRISGRYSTVSRRADTVSHGEQSFCFLLWAKWHYDMFFSQSFGFLLSVSFYRRSIFTHVWSGERTIDPLAAAVPQRQSHPTQQ
jgi:hypothetical protein